jgi:Uma2 family endonuclease
MTTVRYASSAHRVSEYEPGKPGSFGNVADLIHRLGDIPAERILMDPLPGTANEDDLLRTLERPESIPVELIDGVLVEKAVGAKESLLAAWLVQALWSFAEENDLGVVLGEGAPTRLRLGLVRLPDVSFVSWRRIPGDEFPDDAISGLVPNLAVEVLSPSNTKREIELKLDEYFKAGVQTAWIIDPKSETARIYTSRSRFSEISPDGELVAGRILPGFRLTLRDVFAASRRRRKKRKPR